MRGVLVVGATDGIGLAVARAWVARGWRVGLVGRDPGKLEGALLTLRGGAGPGGPGDGAAPAALGTATGVLCDVTDGPRSVAAFEEVLRALGQLDVLVYTAGVMEGAGEAGPEGDPGAEATGDPGVVAAGARGAATTRDPGAAAHRMAEVNLVGAIRWLELGAAYMAAAGRGRLVAVGSIAGDRGRKGNPAYGATKAGLHAYLEGLRHRLHGSGVGVTTIKPGFVRTRMLGDEPPTFPPPVAVERAAELIVRAAERGRDQVYVPWWWGLVSLALRSTPRPLYKRIAPP